jgi:hypothetical protein
MAEVSTTFIRESCLPRLLVTKPSHGSLRWAAIKSWAGISGR